MNGQLAYSARACASRLSWRGADLRLVAKDFLDDLTTLDAAAYAETKALALAAVDLPFDQALKHSPMTQLKLLSDDQVREFIANGFLRITPDVEGGLHKDIDALLRYAVEQESWYGNNILARIPKMHQVLNCSAVRGALSQHRRPRLLSAPASRRSHQHASCKVVPRRSRSDADGPRMGNGSRAGSGWHQDRAKPALARSPPTCHAM